MKDLGFTRKKEETMIWKGEDSMKYTAKVVYNVWAYVNTFKGCSSPFV